MLNAKEVWATRRLAAERRASYNDTLTYSFVDAMTETSPPSRRDFLATATSALGGAWLAVTLPAIVSLSACARDAARRGEAFSTLTDAEGDAMAAFAANILPSDDVPGATEAGAVYFVDAALAGPFAAMHGLIKEGLADLDSRAAKRGAARFSALAPETQVEVMKEIEETPFFANARMLTMMGVLADPSYGGNRDNVGYAIVRRELGTSWQPPFGHYDAEVARGTTAGGAS